MQKALQKSNIIYRTKASYDFEEVDIFLRVKGRLPNENNEIVLLPRDFKSYKCVGQPPQWECSNKNLKWHCDPKKGIYREAMHGDTEAEARFLMRKYLIENKLM